MTSAALFHLRCYAFLWWLVGVLLWLHVIPVKTLEDSFQFTRPLYRTTIYENSAGKTYVTPSEKMGIFMADPDMDIRFRIQSGDPDNFFRAESRKVGNFCFLLITKQQSDRYVLNRESRDEYRLKIKAWMKPRGRHKTEAYTDVVVKVLDTNELTPLFLPPSEYRKTVPEDTPLHTSVLKVEAEDADDGINGEIYYSILESTEQFAVHPTTGVITLTRPLRYAERNRYAFTILAQDRGTKSGSSNPNAAKVRIDVSEVNLHDPDIGVKKLPSIVEDGNVRVYAILRITDKDEGVHGQIGKVEIVDGDTSGSFRVLPGQEPEEYNIAVLKFVDRELAPSGYNLTLRAADRGAPQRFAEVRISVQITDRNDNAPVFEKSEYKVEIEEIAPVDTPLLSVRATDRDEGRNALVSYRIEDGNEDMAFAMEARTGLLLLKRPLDAESRVTYILTVVAEDHGGAGMRKRGFCKVHVRVLDANDNDPVFDPGFAETWVKENEFISTVIHTVKAEDADYGDNGYVSYSLANLNPTPFVVDHFSGEVKMKEVLDYESMRRTYTLKIRASDWGTPYRRQSETTLVVHLKDINDNRPQFEKVDCVGYLSRGAPRGTEVITLSALDFDAGNMVSYRIVSGNEDHCFSLDTSGVLTLVCDLQTQKPSSANTIERYLNFTASDGQYLSDVMAVKITLVNNNRNQELANNNAAFQCRETGVTQRLTDLMDLADKNNPPGNGDVIAQLPGRFGENKHSPEFDPALAAEIAVNESVAVGTKILDVKAQDRDLGFNGQVVYAISSGNVDGCFRVDMYNGSLVIVSSLDRERTPQYDLNISAWDLGRPQKMSSRSLLVSVGDANDNAPKFTKASYAFTLTENTAVGTTVVQLRASDRDVGSNAAITYSLATNSEEFAVDPLTGTVTVSGVVDREKQDTYELRVRAVDGSEEAPLTATAAVLIRVFDVNDNAPRFPRDHFMARVLEDLPMGTVVTTLSAYDPDLGEGGRVRYALKSGAHGCFKVDSETGTVRLTTKLDFEERKLYNMTISACDMEMPPLCAAVNLLVEVVDVNENLYPPTFVDDKIVMSGSVKENEPIGTHVLRVLAKDDDKATLDKRIIYSIRDGDGLGRFSIDDQGNIRTLEIFDRETCSGYWLTVYAQDQGAVPLSSRLDVYVDILDVNDNVPQTLEPIYFASVEESSPANTKVVKIEAYDSDSDPNQRFTYHIISGNPQGFFHLDPDSGLITTTNRILDRENKEEHEFELSVNDNGDPALSSTTRVVITVLDKNDNKPLFVETVSHVRILEIPFQNVDKPLFRVIAHDLDSGLNGDINYGLKPSKLNGLFKIHPKTGVIMSQNLKAGQEYEFMVKADDNGVPSLQSTLTIRLEVLSRPVVSQHPPVIQSLNNEITVSETDVAGHFIALVQANDFDNDVLFYDIIGGNEDDEFTININSGNILLAKRLSYTSKSHYILNISVTDGIHTVYESLSIRVVDANDNRPQFEEPNGYEVEISENIPVDTDILQIKATDKDSDKRLHYAIHSSVHPDSRMSFRIEPSTGVLRTGKRLDREALHRHVLTVSAVDYAPVIKHNFVRVVINVADSNDHPPIFLSDKFEGKVYETAAMGTAVIQTLAIDKDKGENAEIRFSILSGNMGSVFAIDPVLGIISVVKELDVTTVHEYVLIVKATDNGNPPLSSTVSVHIAVTIADDAPPKFEKDVYSAEIQENLHEGSTVIIVGANSRSSVYYEIIRGDEDRLFAISPNSGTVSCTLPLDYETINFFNLTIQATNMVNQRATSTLLVHVLDTNDNCPVFKNSLFVGNITESAVIGSVVLDSDGMPLIAAAEDKDSELNALLVYEIVEKVSQKYFTIDVNTGAIRTIAKLDHEVQLVFEFTVQVSDMGIPRRIAEIPAHVKIYVNDINDSPPQFEHQKYNATILLPTYTGVLVVVVKANDPDTDTANSLQYKIIAGNNKEMFAIDDKTGAITVVNFVHAKGEYTLTVRASDGIYAATTRVVIKVEEMPSAGLRFGKEQYYANVMENASEVSIVVVVNVVGTELNEHVMFRILNPEGLFNIGETSGVVRTTGVPFDRELKESYEIAVEAQSQYNLSKIAHAMINVNVMDVNDNKPMFVNLPYHTVVPISARKGDVVFKVQAIDVDIGDNGDVNYELSDRDEGIFQIHRKTGEVTLRRILDEPNKEYKLIIIADDGGMDPLQTQTTLTIKVIHSKMPIFESQYYKVSIMENIQPYSPVLSMQAYSPEGRKLIYSIVAGNVYEEFAVDFNTDPDRSNGPCVISVVDNLDYETIKEYKLTVRATDSVSGEFSDVLLSVHIEDVNDNLPQFVRPVYKASVGETVQPGASIAKVEATDRDSGLNRQLHYRILNDAKNSTSLFHIGQNDGIITLKELLDFEKQKVHDFIVMATDGGHPALSSTTHVYIYVQDRNDNAPYFAEHFYTSFLSERSQRGQFVTMVVAFDPDVNDQSKLTYSVIAGNDQQVFSIAKKSGIITLGNPHKLNRFVAHILNISVSDGVHTGYTSVKVDVISANLHMPEFARARYDIEFEENRQVGSLVANITATDADDLQAYGQLEYDLQSDYGKELFSIDSKTGKVTSKKGLDREAQAVYEIPITATDAGGCMAVSLLRIIVTDRNDNPPFFYVSDYKATVHSTATIGSVIIKVHAIDLDAGLAASLEYFIYGESEDSAQLFDVNNRTGDIFLAQSALPYEHQVFQFFVRVQDQGFPSLHADAPISIFIASPRDILPKFNEKLEPFFIYEYSPMGTLITTLSAVSNESLTYTLASKYEMPSGSLPFSINNVNELVVSGSLDREVTEVYILVVKAETHTSPPLTAYTNISIKIMDTNDNAPEFECSIYNVSVSENTKEGSSVMRVVARDKDTGHNKDIRFSVESISPLTEASVPFEIDTNTGWITTLVKLDRETVQSYELIVMAADNGNPPLSSSTTVHIVVTDYNDNPPQFAQSYYKAAVNEDALIDTVVITLVTHDKDDADINSRVAYYITSGDPNGHFNIKQNGEIYVNKELDRETIDVYHLVVTATDGTFVSTTHVEIISLDANDNPPVCKKSRYTNKIAENIAPDTYILTIEASDIDEDHNAQMKYSLRGEGAYDFSLDNSGFLKTVKSLDRETFPRYLLAARIQDRNHPEWECVSDVEIILSDVNDNPPSFTQRNYSVAVPEDTEVKMLITKVHATDRDLGINRKVRYSFVDSANGNFVIDEMSGIITLAKPLDREEKSMFNLTVRVTDMGTPQLSSLANVLVIVLDINDNPPEFASKLYYAVMSESARLGAIVVRVLATSKDSGVNAEISYSIAAGNEHGMFTIHPKTGVITVQKLLDYEQSRSYILTIQANDGGTPSLSNSAVVNVSISDSNDNAPIFEQVTYYATVREDAAIGDRVLWVFATDADGPTNNNISYYIARGDSKTQFKMERYTGFMTIASSLDRETAANYTIEVKAIDSGSPALFSYVSVNIAVTDANDNPPVFSLINHTGIVQEDRPEGFTILKFIVSDPDTRENGPPFKYEIRRGNEGREFRVMDDGTLRTAAKFNHKAKNVYMLQVRVYDNGMPALFSDTWVSVEVIEESRFAPAIKSLEVSVHSYMDEFPGGIIGRVKASDRDPYDILAYGIINHRDLFDIDEEDGTINALPGLDVGVYHLNVSVKDGKFTSYSSVKINVNLITDEMLKNAVIIRLEDVTPEDFILNYHKDFLKAIRNLLSIRPKELEILSIQSALEGGGRTKRHSKPDLDVMFSVHRSRSRFYTADALRKTILDNKSRIEIETKLKIVGVLDNLCTPTLCNHGECQSRLTFDDKMVVIVTTDTASYVSPQHHHRLECQCDEGYGGQFCDSIVNACARAQCPLYKICVPDLTLSGYSCQCPPGKSGPRCLENISKCIEDDCYKAKNPMSFGGKSYAAYTLVNAMDRHFILTMKLRTLQPRSCLMYSAGKIDYSILEVVNGFVQYRFDCGSGVGQVRVDHIKINDDNWHEISLTRQGSTAELIIDNKHRAQGGAPGFNVVLNVESNDVYFGAEVQPHHAHGYEDIRMGFIGCMDDIRVDSIELPLHEGGTNVIASHKRFANVEYQCLATVNPGICGSQPCLNGGTCKEKSDTYSCHCPPRFTGDNCEVDTNPCASERCLNGGICSNRPNDFVCDCPSGLTGKRCEFGRHCNPNPCQNGGMCEESQIRPICKCRGYIGDTCTIDINECSKNPCHNGALCFNMPGSFRCQCLPNTTGNLCESTINGSSIISTGTGISFEETLGIAMTVIGIFLLAIIFVLVRKCRLKRARQRQNNAIALEAQKDLVLKNKTQDDIKRTSKVSNLEAYTGSHHHPHVPPRPLSYTPSNHDSYTSALNNYETVRSYGSAGDDLENINRYSNEFLQTINKTASIPPSLPPPPPSNSPSDSDSLHKPSWSLDNNLKDNYCEPKIQNDMKYHVGLHEVTLPPAENFRDPTGVPSVSVVPSIDEDLPAPPQGNDKGYHWDCSDWASPSQNPLPNITEIPTNEVPDSPSIHSNESNSQVGEDHSTSTVLGPLDRRLLANQRDPEVPHLSQRLLANSDDGDRDSEYVGDSEFNDNDLDEPDSRELLQPNFEQQILSLNGLDFNDGGSDTYRPSGLSYHRHPDQYLPNYDNITAANTDTETEENGNYATRSGRPGSSVGGLHPSYGYLGHHRLHDPRRSLELPATDDMSVSVGGYTSTNASCSDISGNLCEIEDSEVCSDVDLDVEDLQVKKLVQNTASTAL